MLNNYILQISILISFLYVFIDATGIAKTLHICVLLFLCRVPLIAMYPIALLLASLIPSSGVQG